MILTGEQSNIFQTNEVYFPFMKFRFEISSERYFNLELSKPLFILPTLVENTPYVLMSEIQSFERGSMNQIFLQLYVYRIARVISRDPFVCIEIKDPFNHFEKSIGNLIDQLNHSSIQLTKIKTTESLNLRERLQNYQALFKENYYSFNYEKIEALIYGLGNHVMRSPGDKLKFLFVSNDNRVEYLIKGINLKIEEIFLEHKVQTKLRDRISKQQKNFLISERIKLLEEQFSDEGRDSEDYEQFNKWKKAPDYFKKICIGEKKKLSSLGRNSPEYPQQKKVVEYFSSLPWESNKTYIPEDEVKEHLNSSHFGLKKVKEDILDYITAYRISSGRFNKVLCLVGGPGVGKSSIAKSIARALNREFIKISLAGASESSLLLGSSRVYINSVPGMIINRISKLKYNNPAILIDEIDKTINRGNSNGGTGLEYALLDILDAENNSSFKDHFLDEEYSLKNVLFIVTANTMSNIPVPLLNRLSPIFINPYTTEEKIAITNNWLIPNMFSMMGLPEDSFVLEKELIKDIIENFTWEAGVRSLRYLIEKLIIAFVRNKVIPSELNIDFLEKQLKWKKILVNDSLMEKAVPLSAAGRNLGLWASPDGIKGGLIVIDVLSCVRQNQNQWKWPLCTGSAGKVMEESSKQAFLAAYHFLSKRGGTELASKLLLKDWIIHYGNTSAPKEGPSAGLATTIAILSESFNLEVANFLMTGEINFRGEVMAIGGLEQKLLGVKKNQLSKVLIPQANVVDLDKIGVDVKEGLKIEPLVYLEEAVRILWPNILDGKGNLNKDFVSSLAGE